MDEREFRVDIKHNFLKKKTAQKTKLKLDKPYGESAPSIRTINKWFDNFEVVIWALKMVSVRVGLVTSQQQKTSQKLEKSY